MDASNATDHASGARERVCPSCARANPPDARFCAGCARRFLGDELEPEPVADPLVGRTIADRYRIEQMIGRGAMGVVYRVEHVRIGKLMAMKLLHGELSREKDVMRRFRREAEAASKLDHPNTVQVFDFGRADGLTYLVMELLGGRDLGAIVEQEGPLPFARVARIAAQIAGSVSQAHSRGIVHRDLKPENVRVLQEDERELVKVMDFGLAKLREHDEAPGASITRAGFIVGTPYYMAPEQIRGDAADPRSDVYALGALMYKCLTGVPPFQAPTPVAVLTKHLTDPVVPPSVRSGRTDLSPEAEAIVLRTLEKDPRARPQSMDALREELLAFLRAQGEETVSFAERATLPSIAGATELATESGRKVQVATRSDVDRYERSLRAQSWGLYALGAVLIAALTTGGVLAYRSAAPGVASATESALEREPNDGPAQAGELPEGRERSGHLGRRMDPEHSDADVWAIRNAGGRGRAVSIDFSGLPNMDTVLEVFRAGQSEPLLVVDGAGSGAPERVPNLVLVDPLYYVRVREQWLPGRHPTENVSDAYTLRWSYVQPAPGDEREVNDTLALAERIELGRARQGFVGWSGDADAFCVSADAPEAIAILEPVPRLDLVLRVEERHLGRSSIVDDHGLGEGEQVVLRELREGSTCVVVSAREGEGRASSDPSERWSLRLVAPGASGAAP